MFRQVLPRQIDMLNDNLVLQSGNMTAEEAKLFVQDAEYAYWQIPLDPLEQRYYCCMLRMPNGTVSYLVYMVTAQGSRGAPLSWSVIFGLIGRCVLSVLRDPAMPGATTMQTYVDDPALALRGTTGERRLQVARAMLTWTILGVPLALTKGQFGTTINWIGATFTVLPGGRRGYNPRLPDR